MASVIMVYEFNLERADGTLNVDVTHSGSVVRAN